MVDQVLLYISTAPDMELERDLLSRTGTEIPVTLGWRIVHTPLRGDKLDLVAITQAAIHLLILGNATFFQLRPAEYKGLENLRKELTAGGVKHVEGTRGGAGASSVILSSDRFVPRDGVQIRDSSKTIPSKRRGGSNVNQ